MKHARRLQLFDADRRRRARSSSTRPSSASSPTSRCMHQAVVAPAGQRRARARTTPRPAARSAARPRRCGSQKGTGRARQGSRKVAALDAAAASSRAAPALVRQEMPQEDAPGRDPLGAVGQGAATARSSCSRSSTWPRRSTKAHGRAARAPAGQRQGPAHARSVAERQLSARNVHASRRCRQRASTATCCATTTCRDRAGDPCVEQWLSPATQRRLVLDAVRPARRTRERSAGRDGRAGATAEPSDRRGRGRVQASGRAEAEVSAPSRGDRAAGRGGRPRPAPRSRRPRRGRGGRARGRESEATTRRRVDADAARAPRASRRMNVNEVLIKPLHHREEHHARRREQVHLRGRPRANKIQIKEAVETIFKRQRDRRSTPSRSAARRVAVGRTIGKTPAWKKAIVTLRARPAHRDLREASRRGGGQDADSTATSRPRPAGGTTSVAHLRRDHQEASPRSR